MRSKGMRKERITVRLTPNQMQCLKELSESLDTSYSLLVRSIIQDFLVKNDESLQRIVERNNNENGEYYAYNTETTEEREDIYSY